MGQLEYRSLRFEEAILEEADFQGRSVIYYCDSGTKFTRIIEHKHFADMKSQKTVITYEYPEIWMPGKEPYYPVNDERNNELYLRYLELAKEYPNVIFGGMLGNYQYYNMDEVIADALKQAKREFEIDVLKKK